MRKHLALISVSDATGSEEVALALVNAGYEIVATSGTAKKLRAAGIPAEDVGALTGYPELFGGRVKTLHPMVHGGILYRRGNEGDEKEAKEHDVVPIDIVIANLYPFEKTVAAHAPHAECIENIDIGGVALIRSAGKNQAHVTVVVDPADYGRVAAALKKGISQKMRAALAAKAFGYTARYDAAIAAYLAQRAGLPQSESSELVPKTPARSLRYGENPHQKAVLYGDLERVFTQLHGKELSYNNMLDIASARGLIREFEGDMPTVAILKHTNPCGVGRAATLAAAWERAYATDRSAPFGGVVVTNAPVDRAAAKKMSALFLEIVLAPAFAPDALALLKEKKSIRLVTYAREKGQRAPAWQLRSIGEGIVLGQDDDRGELAEKTLRTVSKRTATTREREALLFAWKVAKHVKSNAVVYAGPDRTLGIGAGQMSRVDSSRIAIHKAKDAKLSLKGSAVASDAFLPFADTLVAAAKAGATALIQPGGSIRDDAVIAAADKHKMAMVFTGVRHFKH